MLYNKTWLNKLWYMNKLKSKRMIITELVTIIYD